MLAAAVTLLAFIMVGVIEPFLWEKRRTVTVITYGIMMAITAILTALFAMGIEPPKMILVNFVRDLFQKLKPGG